MRSNWYSSAIVASSLLFVAISAADDNQITSEMTVKVRIADGESLVPFTTQFGATAVAESGPVAVPAGASKITLVRAESPILRYHLIAKTFLPYESLAQNEFIQSVKAAGYDPQIIVQGREFRTESNSVVDNRMFLVSIARCASQADAERMKKSLEQQQHWCYIVSEVVKPGAGTIKIDGAGTFDLPVALIADHPVELVRVNTGYWKENRNNQKYTGTIDLEIGPDGKLMVIETVSLESYLLGVLPAEMPHEWPLEALKAQAIAARSEVLANVAGKHALDGYDFCGTEHCRAYLGSANGKPRTDRALDETRGGFLVRDGRIVTTVFSATCGGWTENNDSVWSGRAQPALRGIADAPLAASLTSPREMGVWKWLDAKSNAYCKGDSEYFRWRRSFTQTELTAIVNKSLGVGRVQSIEMGKRGVSGRLESVKVVGASATRSIQKELNIRRTFGGLPSALFVVSNSKNKSGETVFTFIGAGRGHGVGLCQNGARGMADAGIAADEIVTHYFVGAAIERYK